MTSMFVAQRDLIAEVKGRILALAPEYEEQIRFTARDDVDRALSDMDEDLGLPRMFEIGSARYELAHLIGAGTRALKYHHQISINYPHDETWGIGMHSDFELIRYDLINNSTSVSGVQQRHLDPTAETIVEIDDEDSWARLILDLVVYYEIS